MHKYAGSNTKPLIPAFTLIELLIAIAIIAALASVLIPVFLSVRARAANTACLSNLRQLYLAVSQYASENDSLLPPYGTDFGSGFGNTFTHMEVHNEDHAAELTVVLNPYIKEPALWFCPSDEVAHTASKEGSVNHLYTSYKTGPNWYAMAEKPLPVLGRTFMDRPDLGIWQEKGDMVLFTDDLWYCVLPVGPLGTPEVPPLYSHKGRYNSVMFDGHVVSFSRDQALCGGVP